MLRACWRMNIENVRERKLIQSKSYKIQKNLI